LYLEEMVLTSYLSVLVVMKCVAAYLVSLGLGVGLEEPVVDKVISDLGIVPSAEHGRLGSGVVFI
jgi:hypothetical protein